MQKNTKTGSKASFGIKSSANSLMTNIFHVSEVQTIVTSLLLIKKIVILCIRFFKRAEWCLPWSNICLQAQLQGVAITTLINIFININLIFVSLYCLYCYNLKNDLLSAACVEYPLKYIARLGPDLAAWSRDMTRSGPDWTVCFIIGLGHDPM